MPDMHILVVEDDPDGQEVVTRILRHHRITTDVVASGEEALELLRTHHYYTAAVIDQLDLVITVDTAVAHLAGALGKPVWVLLAFHADFRWLRDREDCPWYPSARLFRQARIGDWNAVLERVSAELKRGFPKS